MPKTLNPMRLERQWLPYDMYQNVTSPHNDLPVNGVAFLNYIDRQIEESYIEASEEQL